MNSENMDFPPKSVQVALFFSPDSTYRPLSFAVAITNALGDVFPQDPNIISLPPNVPLEFPRIIFANEQESTLKISLNRADLFMKVNAIGDFNEKIIPVITKVHEVINENLKINIKRVGLVNTYTVTNCKTSDIISKYFIPGKIDHSDEISLSWHKSNIIENLKTNVWVRLTITDNVDGDCSLITDINSDVDITSLGNNAINLIRKYDTYLREDFDNVISWI